MEFPDIGSSEEQAYRRIASVNSDGGLRKSADKLRKQKSRKTGTLDTRGVVHEVQSDCPEHLNFEVSLGPAQRASSIGGGICRASRGGDRVQEQEADAPRLAFSRPFDVDREPSGLTGGEQIQRQSLGSRRSQEQRKSSVGIHRDCLRFLPERHAAGFLGIK